MLSLVVGVLASSQDARGGASSSTPVTVDTAQRRAFGSLLDARNGSGNQYIGCSVNYSTGSAPNVNCSATDAAGTSQYCVANASTNFATVATAVSSSSS